MIFNKDQQNQLIQLKKYDEIELRLKLNQDQIKKIHMQFWGRDDESIIQSVTVQNESLRKESWYQDGKKINGAAPTFVEKIQFVKFNILDNIVFTVATESTIDENQFKAGADPLIRIKDRRSYPFLGGDLQFTRVGTYTLKTIGSKIATTIERFFNTIEEGTWEFEFELNKQDLRGVQLLDYLNTSIIELMNTMQLTDLINIYLMDIANRMGIILPNPSIKRIGNNPRMLDRSTYESLNKKNYYILEKSDGLRSFVQLYANGWISMVEGRLTTHGTIEGNYHLLDCELMEDDLITERRQHANMKCGDNTSHLSKNDNHYLVFDILIYDGRRLMDGLIERIDIMRQLKLPPNFKLKDILPYNRQNIERLYRTDRIDGIIFNELGKSYKDMKIYKWKPSHLITFDFMIVPLPKKYQGIKPFITESNMYLLMCGCKLELQKKLITKPPKFFNKIIEENGIVIDAQYNPYIFSSGIWETSYIWESSNNYQLSIGEFELLRRSGTPKFEWNLVKIRQDKTLLIPNRIFGNDYKIIQQHFMELQNPLSIDELKDGGGDEGAGYFMHNKSLQYKAMAKFNGKVKYMIMSVLKDTKHVLDIASGKGQDMFIYNGIGVQEVTFVEPDEPSVNELMSRIESLGDRRFYIHTPMPHKTMKTNVFNLSYDKFIELYPHNKYDAFVCNFAIHYILTSKEAYVSFASYCHAIGARIVILTCFDIEVLSKFLPIENEKYNVYMKNGLLYVKHHFSDEHYPEYPINHGWLCEAMKKHYNLLVRDSFGEFLDIADLDEIDSNYCSMYQYYVFRMK